MSRLPLLAAVCAVPLALLPVAPASAAVIDIQTRECGVGVVTAKLERDGGQREIDVEVYASPRQRWSFIVRDTQGSELVRMARTTNREGEFDTWRYLPTRPDAVSVAVRGPSGSRCTIELRS